MKSASPFAEFLAGSTRATPRLILRLLRPEDADALYAILSDLAVARWIYFVARPYSHEHAAAWCARAKIGAGDGKELLFAVDDKATGAMIGNAGFHLLDDGTRAEIGYWLASAAHGKGLATEIATALVALAADFPHVKTLTATAAPDNASSIRVLEKTGFTKTGTINVTAQDGSQRHSDVFSRPVNQSG